MDIPINAAVYCTEGICGKSTVVILDPTTGEITHIVVKERSFPNLEHLVSINHIKASTPDSIQLICSAAELQKMDQFIEHKFIQLDEPFAPYPAGGYLVWPYVQPIGDDYIDLRSEQIPLGELAIHRGAQVKATDGAVGTVDEFMINPKNRQVSHFVMREGHLWGKKDVTIPIGEVAHFSDDIVYLKLDKAGIEALPSVPLRR